MKALTTGATIVSLAAIAGCASHGSDDRYSNRSDRAGYHQDGSGYDRMGGTSNNHNGPGYRNDGMGQRTDGGPMTGEPARHDGKWNSSDQPNRVRDWQNSQHNGAYRTNQ